MEQWVCSLFWKLYINQIKSCAIEKKILQNNTSLQEYQIMQIGAVIEGN